MTDIIDQFLDDSAMYDDGDENNQIHPPIVVEREEINQNHSDLISNTKEDYELVRTNMKQIVETNIKALRGLAKVAQESESPRAYEVLSNFMKQMVDSNQALIEIHKDVKDILVSNALDESSRTHEGGTTNNFFTGSTEDLLKVVEQMKREERIVIDVDAEVNDPDQS